MEIIFVWLAILILVALIVFQIALIAGAPIGYLAWGGQHKVLPLNLRIASVSSIVIYLLIGIIILSKSGVTNWVTWQPFLDISIWVLFVYFLLGVFLNLITRSKYERMIMPWIAGILAICCLIIAI